MKHDASGSTWKAPLHAQIQRVHGALLHVAQNMTSLSVLKDALALSDGMEKGLEPHELIRLGTVLESRMASILGQSEVDVAVEKYVLRMKAEEVGDWSDDGVLGGKREGMEGGSRFSPMEQGGMGGDEEVEEEIGKVVMSTKETTQLLPSPTTSATSTAPTTTSTTTTTTTTSSPSVHHKEPVMEDEEGEGGVVAGESRSATALQHPQPTSTAFAFNTDNIKGLLGAGWKHLQQEIIPHRSQWRKLTVEGWYEAKSGAIAEFNDHLYRFQSTGVDVHEVQVPLNIGKSILRLLGLFLLDAKVMFSLLQRYIVHYSADDKELRSGTKWEGGQRIVVPIAYRESRSGEILVSAAQALVACLLLRADCGYGCVVVRFDGDNSVKLRTDQAVVMPDWLQYLFERRVTEGDDDVRLSVPPLHTPNTFTFPITLPFPFLTTSSSSSSTPPRFQSPSSFTDCPFWSKLIHQPPPQHALPRVALRDYIKGQCGGVGGWTSVEGVQVPIEPCVWEILGLVEEDVSEEEGGKEVVEVGMKRSRAGGVGGEEEESGGSEVKRVAKGVGMRYYPPMFLDLPFMPPNESKE